MPVLSQPVLCYGQDTELPAQVALQAGPLRLLFEHGSIRQIKLGAQVVLQQIYAAVRDQNWGTIEPVLSELQIAHDDQQFQINFLAHHTQGEIDFSWRGSIAGGNDGTIVFRMLGEANSDFLANRVGFCVLHPASCAGLPCWIEHTDSQRIASSFPLAISPSQPFYDIRAITYAAAPNLGVEVRLEGDTFEMEDQRNWTDASFKTYCTPLAKPFPAQLMTGERVVQTITLRLLGEPGLQSGAESGLSISIGQDATSLPAIGLGCAHGDNALSQHELGRLRALGLAHLRFDLDMRRGSYVERLLRAASEANQIGAGLEIALTLTANANSELQTLAEQLQIIELPVVRWLIFHCDEKSTSGKWVVLARQVLAAVTPGAAFGGGTDAFFTELNRNRPDSAVMDCVSFSTNPQVHAFDNLSLAETLPIHRDLIMSTRQFVEATPIVVSPISLKMRWNPNATAAAAPHIDQALPHNVDVRQMSLFGAVWTLGTMKYLAEAGVSSITYYETVGWLGVMETEAGSPMPQHFQSIPGGVFPVYHLFANLGAYAEGSVVHSQSSDPQQIVALMLRQRLGRRLLIGNLTPRSQAVQISGAEIAGQWICQSLDPTSAEYAMREPEAFQSLHGETLEAIANSLTVTLLPYSLLRMDATL